MTLTQNAIFQTFTTSHSLSHTCNISSYQDAGETRQLSAVRARLPLPAANYINERVHVLWGGQRLPLHGYLRMRAVEDYKGQTIEREYLLSY